jgi:hypothetical protein
MSAPAPVADGPPRFYQGAPEPLLNEAERAIAVAAEVACTAAAARASEDSQAIRHKAEGAKAFGHAGWAGTPSVAQGNAVGIDVLAAQDCQLVAEDQDLDLVGVRRPPPQHHQLEKAAQRQVDERPDHPHLQRDDSTRRRTIALLITPPLNPRD